MMQPGSPGLRAVQPLPVEQRAPGLRRSLIEAKVLNVNPGPRSRRTRTCSGASATANGVTASSHARGDAISLTIAPTIACNKACAYCCQNEYTKSTA